jgi:hypothetical protein
MPTPASIDGGRFRIAMSEQVLRVFERFRFVGSYRSKVVFMKFLAACFLKAIHRSTPDRTESRASVGFNDSLSWKSDNPFLTDDGTRHALPEYLDGASCAHVFLPNPRPDSTCFSPLNENTGTPGPELHLFFCRLAW